MPEIAEPETGLPSLPDVFDVQSIAPDGMLSGLVARMTHYRELRPGCYRQAEAASLIYPLIISFGEPFRIGLGREPRAHDSYGTFAAGLFAGPVMIESSGASHCIQIDFTPIGARRFFRLPMRLLADQMLDAGDVLGPALVALRERLGNAMCVGERFAIARRFVETRLDAAAPLNPGSELAYRRLRQSGGRMRIERIAAEIGWSRKHLATRFREDFGLGAKAVARIIRFRHALDLARGDAPAWADIAAACGYADQSHLIREFRSLSGAAPGRLTVTG
ncbi:MAG: helix-turn-helix transcriptional regulator [Rhizobiaceae bacterium]|nr:helix-turn-helix transcriptional regulator [Rhizobiaceae bacterium]